MSGNLFNDPRIIGKSIFLYFRLSVVINVFYFLLINIFQVSKFLLEFQSKFWILNLF